MNKDKKILLIDDEDVTTFGSTKVLQEPGVEVDCAGYQTKNKDKRLLLIDDEEVITFGFKIVLQDPGVEVDCAQTVEEASHLIATHRYDAAIVDLSLSNATEMEGFELIRLLRSCQSECKIIVVTAYGGNGFKGQAEVLGVDLFYEKPIEPEKIRETLKTFGIYKG
jgi:DNA-binding response OmpR family regulator